MNIRRRTMLLILIGLVFLMVQAAESHGASRQVGSIAALVGKASILHKGTDSPEWARPRAAILFLDLLETQERSRAKLLFKDDSIIILGEMTRLRITEYVYSPERKIRRSIFEMLSGKLKVIASKHLGFQSTFQMRTLTAALGVRGTLFIIWIHSDPQSGKPVTSILMLEGSAEVSNIDPAVPGVVILTKGMITRVAWKRPPSKPRPATKNEIQGALQGMDVTYRPKGPVGLKGLEEPGGGQGPSAEQLPQVPSVELDTILGGKPSSDEGTPSPSGPPGYKSPQGYGYPSQ